MTRTGQIVIHDDFDEFTDAGCARPVRRVTNPLDDDDCKKYDVLTR
jgi:hypothetical protein